MSFELKIKSQSDQGSVQVRLTKVKSVSKSSEYNPCKEYLDEGEFKECYLTSFAEKVKKNSSVSCILPGDYYFIFI